MRIECEGRPVRVFLTIDPEIWAPGRLAGSPPARHAGEAGDRRGLPYRLETLRRHGLRATYFVDSLFSRCLGARLLDDAVSTIAGAGQEIGLHLHPKWFTDPRCWSLPKFAGPLLRSSATKAGTE